MKLAVGAFAGYVLYRFAEHAMARRGMQVVLGLYLALMGVHIVTGFSALGWQAPATVLSYFVSLPNAFVASSPDPRHAYHVFTTTQNTNRSKSKKGTIWSVNRYGLNGSNLFLCGALDSRLRISG